MQQFFWVKLYKHTEKWYFTLLSPHTFEIEEPLFTEPLLYLASGQTGVFYQPVDLSHYTAENVNKWGGFTGDAWDIKRKRGKKKSYFIFFRKRALRVAGPQHRQLLCCFIGIDRESQHFGWYQLGCGHGYGDGLNDGGTFILCSNYRGGQGSFERLGHLW